MCYCGSEKQYADCCGRYIDGGLHAGDPLTLMKSRYSAFCTQATEYLVATCSASALQNNQADEVAEFAKAAKFIKLEIVDTNLNTYPGEVEFKAFYLFANTLCCIHERSTFIEQNGQWLYDSGTLMPTPEHKLSRNDACPCDSGKKYKKCCGS
ncbi:MULTISPECIES: YchJ family protein [unclassified Pseudoalteromonas]|uniref:YchJ family protein n=1 Tax=unclassified Pseudoalteromonas TaxID=194690 RepID=UPI000CF6ED1E|nr:MULTISPECIES: YchJ family metal-binding protein [unclassified Pseudoalteromonas]MBS3796434.1 SEC-C domain-containing protein [Pseudoalteromonas sp. BDTF-M6]